MEIKAIVEATVTDGNGSVDVVSSGDGLYRIEFGLLGISPRPAAQMDGKRLRLVLKTLDDKEPTDIPRDGDSPRIYVKPDGMLVEIAAEISDDGQQPTDWVDATVKRDELRNAIADVLAIEDALGK